MYGQTSACHRFLVDQYLIVLRKARVDRFMAMCFPLGLRVVAGAAVTLGGLALAPGALAADFYWDIDGTTPAAGGSTPAGNWGNLGTNWSSGAAGTIATLPTTTGLGDNLTFAAGSTSDGYYVVTLVGTQNAGTITIEEGAPTLAGGDLNLQASATLTTSSTVGIATVGPTIASRITGAATQLTIAGPGTLTFTGANTYTGLTNLSAGTLQIGNGGSTGTLGTADVNNTAILAFNRSDSAYVVSNVIYGAGAVHQVGTGTTTLTGGNLYVGITTIYAGTLKIGNGGATGTLGAGSVTNNSILVFDRSDSAYDVSNVISGPGQIQQNGSGRTTLSGINSYIGATNVNAGILKVGSTSALGYQSAVSVASAAALDVTGTTVGTGTLLLRSGSILIVDGNSRITAASATVQAGAKINASTTGFTPGTQAPIIVTSGAVSAALTNTFDTTPSQAAPAGYRWVSASDATHVYMGLQLSSLAGGPVTHQNTTTQQYDTASSLDRSSGAATVNPDIQASYTQLHQSGAPVGDILEHLGGHTRATYDRTAYMQTRTRTGEALRLSRAPFGSVDGQAVASADFGMGDDRATCLDDLALQTPEGQKWKFFAYGSHTEGDKPADSNGAGKSTSSSNGLTVGASNQLAEDWNVGVALGYDDGSTSSASGAGDTDVKSYSVNLYASHTLDADKRWLVSGDLGVSRTNYDSTRSGVGVGGGTASNSTDGMSYSAALETGYKLDLWENAQLMPFAGLSYVRSSVGSTTETLPGGSGVALAYDESTTDAWETVVGAEFAQKFKIQDGFYLTPSARVGWHHMLNDATSNAVSTHFVGDPNNSFNTYLQNVNSDAVSVELGLAAQWDRNWKVFANVRDYKELGSNGSNQIGFGAGVQYSF